MLSFTSENIKWESLLFFTTLASLVPAAIIGLADKRGHDEERTTNDCVIAAQFGLVGFYAPLLVAAELAEPVKNVLMAILLLVILVGIVQLFFSRSINRRLIKAQPHDCGTNCAVDLGVKGKWAIFGSNLVIFMVSVLLAGFIAFSPWVLKPKSQPTSAPATEMNSQGVLQEHN